MEPGKIMNPLKKSGFIAIVIFLMFSTACRDCGGKKEKSDPVSLSISPAAQSSNIGESRTFTVITQKTDFSFTPPSGSGCNRSGGSNNIVCVPTAAGTYSITVTATADSTKSATATLTVAQPVVSITISPTTARLRPGQSVMLTVTTQNTGITWPAASAVAGSFTTSGNEVTWTLPAVEGEYKFTVTATADTTKRATATITVFVPSEDPVDTWYFGINNNGLIAGAGFYSDGTVRAFQKNGGSVNVFDHPSAFDYTYAVGINDSGQILGYYENGYFLKTGNNYQAISDYSASGQTYPTDYTGINNSGKLSGYFTDSGIYASGYAKGFIKTGNTFDIIEHPNVSSAACIQRLPCGTWITGINNLGHVVGVYTDSAGLYRGFIKNGGVYTAIDHPDHLTGTVYTWVNGINDSGHAAGYFWKTDESGSPGHGFVFDGAFTPFDHPGAVAGGEGTYILGINNSRQVVGWYDDGEKAVGFLLSM